MTYWLRKVGIIVDTTKSNQIYILTSQFGNGAARLCARGVSNGSSKEQRGRYSYWLEGVRPTQLTSLCPLHALSLLRDAHGMGERQLKISEVATKNIGTGGSAEPQIRISVCPVPSAQCPDAQAGGNTESRA